MKKIYLACPYSDPDPTIMEKRFKEATKAAGILIKKGYIVFSPITHCHPIATTCNLPTDVEFWIKYDLEFLKWCDEMWVLIIPGHAESLGIKMEYDIMNHLKKSTKFLRMEHIVAAPPSDATESRDEGSED